VQSAQLDVNDPKVNIKGNIDPDKLVEYIHRNTRYDMEINIPWKKDVDN
jgi:hypothetical protein